MKTQANHLLNWQGLWAPVVQDFFVSYCSSNFCLFALVPEPQNKGDDVIDRSQLCLYICAVVEIPTAETQTSLPV